MTEQLARGRPTPVHVRARRLLGALLAACTVAVTPGAASAAAPVEPIDQVAPEPGAEPATVIEGYRSSYVHPFVVPAGTEPTGDGSARVTFRLPELVTDVVVSAKLNGGPVGSWLLGDGPAVVPVDVGLPAAAIVAGINEIELETIIPLTIDGTCADSGHPARWIELIGPIETAVPLVAGATTPLTAFPGAMQNDAATTTIVVSAVDGAHLSAAAAIGASIVDELGRDHTIEVVTDRSGAVGTVVSLAINAGRGGIAIGSDDRGLPAVEITATDGDELFGLATALAQPGARARMTGSSIDGATALSLASPEPGVSVREAGTDWLAGITLDDLGYGPTSLDGPGVDRANYSFDLPVGDISSFMTVTVDAAATAGGADWDPAIDVYVNGRLAGNGRLGDQLERFEVDVPNQLLRPGTNFVRLEADLGAPGGCGELSPPTRRIDVMGTTMFRLRHGSPIEPDLDDLPYLLRSTTDTTATAVIAPSSPSVDEARRAVQLAVLLGGRGHAATVVTANEDADEPTTARHLVVFGTPARQPRLAEHARALPLGGSVPDRWPTDIEIQLGGVRHGASIQLARLEEAGVLVAVVAERDADAVAGTDVLLDSDLRGELVGTMAIVAAEPRGAVSVRYDGVVLPPETDGSTTAVDTDATADPGAADRDEATAATAQVAPVGEADQPPGRSRSELILVAVGIALLAAGVIAVRRFGITRPAGSPGV